MNKQNKIYHKPCLSLIISTVVSLHGLLWAQCNECSKENKSSETHEEIKKAKVICDRLKENIENKTLDNPNDSTTDRVKHLDVSPVPIRPKEKTLISCTRNAYLNILKNDPYPQMRAYSAGLLSLRIYRDKDVFEALTNALNDPSIMVRVHVATSLAIYQKNDSTIYRIDPRVEQILRDVAVGKNRSKWNLKGFYSREGYLNNPDSTLEKCWDEMQQVATAGLNKLIGEDKTMEFFDSTEKNGATEEIRKNANRGKKYWNR